MTTFKMPEPVGDIKNYTLCTATISADLSTGTKLYTAEALRDVLEQAALKCQQLETAIDGAGNTYYRPADARQCVAAIRAMKEQIK